MTIVTSQSRPAPYIQITRTGDGSQDGPRKIGEKIMFWQKSAIVTMDVFAVIVGLLIAAPFVLILASPFLVTY